MFIHKIRKWNTLTKTVGLFLLIGLVYIKGIVMSLEETHSVQPYDMAASPHRDISHHFVPAKREFNLFDATSKIKSDHILKQLKTVVHIEHAGQMLANIITATKTGAESILTQYIQDSNTTSHSGGKRESKPTITTQVNTLRKDFVILQLYWWLFSSTKHCG